MGFFFFFSDVIVQISHLLPENYTRRIMTQPMRRRAGNIQNKPKKTKQEALNDTKIGSTS